jgi:hypothetical protein
VAGVPEHVVRTAFVKEDEFKPPLPGAAWVPAAVEPAMAPVTATSSVDCTVAVVNWVGAITVMLELCPGGFVVTSVAANVHAPASARTVIKVAA